MIKGVIKGANCRVPQLFSGHAAGAGFTLIEVLVSLLIFSIGLLGYTILSSMVQARQLEIIQRVYGVQMVDLLAAQLAANPVSKQQIENSFNQWNLLVAESGLLHGKGCIEEAGAGHYRVAVAWQGLTETSAQPSSSCGAGDYGADGLRRVISRSLYIPEPGFLGSGGNQ